MIHSVNSKLKAKLLNYEPEESLKDKVQDWIGDRLPYFLRRPFYILWDWKYQVRKVKYFFQRIFRGYGDDDLWSLDSYIVRKIRPALKAFVKYQKENGHGCPSELFNNKLGEDHECDGWIRVLEKIELAFDLMWEDEMATDEWFKKSTEEHNKDVKKIKVGLNLFGKYFEGLWD